MQSSNSHMLNIIMSGLIHTMDIVHLLRHDMQHKNLAISVTKMLDHNTPQVPALGLIAMFILLPPTARVSLLGFTDLSFVASVDSVIPFPILPYSTIFLSGFIIWIFPII